MFPKTNLSILNRTFPVAVILALTASFCGGKSAYAVNDVQPKIINFKSGSTIANNHQNRVHRIKNSEPPMKGAELEVDNIVMDYVDRREHKNG